MKENIIRDFQACLNEAIAKGRSYKFINWIGYYYKWKCTELWIDNDESYEDNIVISYSELFFWPNSWFLDMIEWKQEEDRGVTINYPNWDYIQMKRTEDNYRVRMWHTMQLSILESDEARMKYILDEIKWFITKK